MATKSEPEPPDTPHWPFYHGDGRAPHDEVQHLPDPPPWRRFQGDPLEPSRDLKSATHAKAWKHQLALAEVYQADKEIVEAVNAALLLRRPLLITGPPGAGKSSLAYSVAHELTLGPVLEWPITTRSTVKDALYLYDAIGRVHEQQRQGNQGPPVPIGDFLTLGPLGTALLPAERPRVLLIDEIDKSDVDLPNDLLNILEQGGFEIPELQRGRQSRERVRPFDAEDDERVEIQHGKVVCRAFPFIILTNNFEREFPPAFLRRCLQLKLPNPDKSKLEKIVRAHLGQQNQQFTNTVERLIDRFLKRRDQDKMDLATDQLLNAVFMATSGGLEVLNADFESLLDRVWTSLSNA